MKTLTTDLVILGSGVAGHRAAIEAAHQGADVVLLEKMPAIGGSTVMSGGSWAFAGTDQQQRSGIEDSVELLRSDLIEVGGGYNELPLLDLYCSLQLEEYRFLLEQDVTFSDIQLSSGQSVPRSHPADPRFVLKRMHDRVSGLSNVHVMLGCAAQRLRCSDGGTRIDEVLAVSSQERMRVRARKGIVVATGGFSRGEKLLGAFAPDLKPALRAGGLGNEGDGIRMAQEFGAELADFGFLKATFGSYLEVVPDEPHTTLLPVYRGAIAVNTQGRRFVDESKSYKKLGSAVLGQQDHRAYQIFDDSIMEHSIDGVPSFDFRHALRKGRIVQADSIADLAVEIGVPREALEQTVSAYNQGVERGEDREFGRKALAHHFGSLVRIKTAPFFGYPCTASINTTYAGIRVGPDMGVRNVWDEPIEGLYAAGEVVGGFHGEAYMTGSSLVKGLIFGRVAAASALSG